VLDPSSATTESFALGLRYDELNSGLRLSAGIPGNADEALWGSLGGWKRLAPRFGGFRAGVDIAGNAFLAMDRASQPDSPIPGPLNPPAIPFADRAGHALAGQALPLVGYESARWQVHARAGMSRYAATFNGQELDRSVRLADVQVTLMPATSFAIVPVVQRFQAAGEEASSYAGVSAIAASATSSAWGSIGQWSADAAAGTPWAAALSAPHPRRPGSRAA
jgi:hypothetical protein